MAPLFNRKRSQSLRSNRIKSYLRYALGEIILVTIGILIALYIKGWYGEIQEQKQIDRAAQLVIDDLRSDTAKINHIVEAYSPREKYFRLIKQDSMPYDSLSNCGICPYLISSMSTFEPSNSGYMLLQKFETGLQSPRDSLLHQTRQFYSQTMNTIELLVDMLQQDVASNMQQWRDEEDWYADWASGNVTEPILRYMAENPRFRNKVANYHILLYGNYLQGLQNYRDEAVLLADQWEALLDSK